MSLLYIRHSGAQAIIMFDWCYTASVTPLMDWDTSWDSFMIRCSLVVSQEKDSELWTAWQWRAALQSGCYIITCLWHHLVCPSRHKTRGRGLLITIMSHIVWIKTGFSDSALLCNVRQYISFLMISENSCVGKGILWPEWRSSKAYLFKAACDSS